MSQSDVRGLFTATGSEFQLGKTCGDTEILWALPEHLPRLRPAVGALLPSPAYVPNEDDMDQEPEAQQFLKQRPFYSHFVLELPVAHVSTSALCQSLTAFGIAILLRKEMNSRTCATLRLRVTRKTSQGFIIRSVSLSLHNLVRRRYALPSRCTMKMNICWERHYELSTEI